MHIASQTRLCICEELSNVLFGVFKKILINTPLRPILVAKRSCVSVNTKTKSCFGRAKDFYFTKFVYLSGIELEIPNVLNKLEFMGSMQTLLWQFRSAGSKKIWEEILKTCIFKNFFNI